MSNQKSLTKAESLPAPDRCSVIHHDIFSLLTGLLDLALKLILLFALKLTYLLISNADAVEIDLADIE
ncbi:MAG: hypothetical protein PVI73_08230 [Syntrophobacterales bacterium]